MVYWISVSLLLTLFYSYQMLRSYVAWSSIPDFKPQTDKQAINSFSFVIPMRNESGNLESLLQNLMELDYPTDWWEVILVDDFSEDDSFEKANKLKADLQFENLKVINMAEKGIHTGKGYKKSAINQGVINANNHWIVTSDADVHHEKGYLRAMDQFIAAYQPKFISGPVMYESEKTALERMESAEFLGLVGLGGAYIQRDQPILCNGANVAYPRESFLLVNGFDGFNTFESGDDIWLMHKMQNRYPFRLYFLKSRDAIVTTKPVGKAADFIEQRKRWTSKNLYYENFWQKAHLSLYYLFYLSIMVNAVWAFLNFQVAFLLSIMVIAKLITEFNLFLSFNRFFKVKQLMLNYILAFPFQICYTVLIVPLSILRPYRWKNRIIHD